MISKIALGIMACVLILLVYGFMYGNRFGENGYYIYRAGGYSYLKTINNERLSLGDILDFEYGDNYIIAKRIPMRTYSCSTGLRSAFPIKKIQYLIINEKNHRIYGSYDEAAFSEKLKELNISLEFKTSHKKILDMLKKREGHYNIGEADFLKVKKCKIKEDATL